MNSSTTESLTAQVLTIPRSDRWQACQRLQELGVHCARHKGDLIIEIITPLDLVQLRSVTQQVTAPRASLLKWLEHCWDVS